MNLLEYLQIKIIEQTPQKITLDMPIKEYHHQPYGAVHGGINGVLIETACSIGANLQLPNHTAYAVGVDLQVNHLKSVSEGTLTVIATPNQIGQTIQVWEGKIFDASNEMTSIGRCTLINRAKIIKN